MHITSLSRDNYGALSPSASTTDIDRAAYLSACSLVALAVKAGKVPEVFDGMVRGSRGKERGRRIGEARHHEIYDFTPSTVLVCARDVEGTRYGQRTALKTYFLVSRHGRGVKVVEVNKAIVAKAAKVSGNILGGVIAVVLGKYTSRALHGRIRLIEFLTG